MPTPLGPYSNTVRAGDLVFCSGQIGKDGDVMADGVVGQTRQALHNAGQVLSEEGLTLANVVKTTVFLTDIGNFPAMNEVYAEAFGEHRPARSTVGVGALPAGAIVEIEVIAHV